MIDVVRAWKEPSYRIFLSDEEKKDLPDNPAGQSWNELDDDDLDDAAGGGAAIVTVPTPTPSGGNVCTATTECPILSFCCPQQ